MAKIVATIKVMPESVEVDLKNLKEKISKLLEKEVDVGKIEEEEIAFGLRALNFVVIADEEKGSLDPLAEKVSKIEGVRNAEVTKVTRAI